MEENLNLLSSKYSYINLNDKSQRFNKIDSPKNENLVNLIIQIETKSKQSNIVNNIYNVALSFPLLILNKDRNNQLISSFIQSPNDIKFKAFDPKKIISNLNNKKHKQLIDYVKSWKVNDLKREISCLCFLIILYCIQDRIKKFKNFKKFFKGIIQETAFQKDYLVDQTYLDQLRNEIKKHEHRKGLASVIVETIFKHNSMELNRKFDSKRQRKFIKFIKKFFYLNPICKSLEYIQFNICGNTLFSLIEDYILEGSDVKNEKNQYYILFKMQENTYGIAQNEKKRIALVFERLFSDENLKKYKLIMNIKTISFYIGLLNLTTDYYKKIEIINSNQIDSKFYALGILLKRFLILNQMKSQIQIAKFNFKSLTINWLNRFLDILDEQSICKYPEILKQGLNRMIFDKSFLTVEYRKGLYSTIDIIKILKKASTNPKEMSLYLDAFIREQDSISINKLEYIKNFGEDKFIYSINDDYNGLRINNEIQFKSLQSGENIFIDSTSNIDENVIDLPIKNKTNNSSTKRILSIKNEKVNDLSIKNENVYDSSIKNENVYDSSIKNENVYDSSIKNENVYDSSIKNENVYDSSIKNENVYDSSIKNEKQSKKHKLDNSQDDRLFKRIKLNNDENLEIKSKVKKTKSKEEKLIDKIILDDDEEIEISFDENEQDQIQNNNYLKTKIKNDLNNNQFEDNSNAQIADNDNSNAQSADNDSNNQSANSINQSNISLDEEDDEDSFFVEID